jgi:hypothetical protein
MKIVINGQWTYETTSKKVKVGDTAVLPSTSWMKDVRPTWKGTVTSLTSDFDGSCVKVIRIIPAKKTA